MILTLCGSARFEPAYHYWNEQLTIRGKHTVFSLAVFPSVKGAKDWYDVDTKAALDTAHIQKIKASNGIFVITRETGFDKPYIGSSTKAEINYAQAFDVKIYYDYDANHLQMLGVAS